MILVDSSVWIDFFRNRPSVQAEWLDRNLGIESLVVGDLILAEVLRGFRDNRGFNEARRMLARLSQVTLGGEDIAVESARNFRKLRARGVTVRGTVDVIIATRWCNPYPSVTPPPPAVCPPTCVCHPPFRNATSIWLPLRFNADNSVAELQWVDHWSLDTTAGATLP